MSSNFEGFLPHVGSGLINLFVGNTAASVVDWKAMDHQLSIIQSEVDELSKAVATRNYNELRDGLNDARFTVDGGAYRMGISVQDDFDALMKSMVSKFDATEEDALKSQANYAAKGIKTEIVTSELAGQLRYVQLSAEDQVVGGKSYPKGKFLKSYLFEEPVYRLPANARAMSLLIPVGENVPYPSGTFMKTLTNGTHEASGQDEVVVVQIRSADGEKVLPNWEVRYADGFVTVYDKLSQSPFLGFNGAETFNLSGRDLIIDFALVLSTALSQQLHDVSSDQIPKVDLDNVLCLDL